MVNQAPHGLPPHHGEIHHGPHLIGHLPGPPPTQVGGFGVHGALQTAPGHQAGQQAGQAGQVHGYHGHNGIQAHHGQTHHGQTHHGQAAGHHHGRTQQNWPTSEEELLHEKGEEIKIYEIFTNHQSISV